MGGGKYNTEVEAPETELTKTCKTFVSSILDKSIDNLSKEEIAALAEVSFKINEVFKTVIAKSA